jgi:ABC-type lipoprotein release transport system permease subunit
MPEMLRLGFYDLLHQRRLGFVLAISISISLMGYLLLNGYQTDLNNRYDWLAPTYLIAQQSGTTGEFYGSRLKPVVAADLMERGASLVVPEIRTVTGTTMDNAVLLRGILPDRYERIEPYRILSGRPLLSDDSPRLAMVGVRLAQERDVLPGGTIEVRGRPFGVVAVFETGIYSDYEVWISLRDAQELLGWGDEVSIFVIPAGEQLRPGDTLPTDKVSISQKGENGTNLVKEFQPLFSLLNLIAVTLGISAAIALANSLWRMAWLRRRELAILQSIGFSKWALVLYLAVQGAGVTGLGFILGLLEALMVGSLISLRTAGVAIHAVYDWRILLISAGYALGILLLSTVLPAIWLARLNLAELLRAE